MTIRRSLTAVVPDFPAPSQTFITRKLLGLRDAGFDVRVAASNFAPGAAETGLTLYDVAPFQHPGEIRSATTRAGWAAAARGGAALLRTGGRPLGLKRLAVLAPLAAIESDIVHFEFSGVAVAYREMLDRLAPARIVISCRGAAEQILPVADPSRLAPLREVLGKADMVHCVSDDMRRTVEALGAPPERILVNRPAVPVADFAALAAARRGHDGPLRLASVGRLHWKKGLDDGIRAVARAIERGTACEYRIGGAGDEREKLAFMIDQLGVTEHVHLLGRRTQPEVQELLTWADVLLLPSLSEGISNAVLEAMASGLPVVATRSGGMDEVITTGVDGVLVDVGDVEAMADHLGELAGDPERRASLGRAATHRVRDAFDISRQIAVFATAYEALLDR